MKLTVKEVGPVVLTLTRGTNSQVPTDNTFELTPLSHGCCMSAPRRLDAECSALQQLLSGTSCKQVSSICVYLTSHTTTTFFHSMQPSLLQTLECFDVAKQPSRPRQAEWIEPEPLRLDRQQVQLSTRQQAASAQTQYQLHSYNVV